MVALFLPFMRNNRKISRAREATLPKIFSAPTGRTIQSPAVVAAHQMVASWLNCSLDNTPEIQELLGFDDTSRGRVISLLEQVRECVGMRIIVPPERSHLLISLGPIDKMMSRYPIYPTLAYDPGTESLSVLRRLVPGSAYPNGETMAAHGIIELARNGRACLGRLRECRCGRWFFARKDASLACGPACKQKIYDQRPEIKERKRALNKANTEIRTGRIFMKPSTSKLPGKGANR